MLSLLIEWCAEHGGTSLWSSIFMGTSIILLTKGIGRSS